ncbi:Diacylglycerol acyltransferase [Corchorus olitorius]|uniref:Diacylglycerol acyltransferase n=1 Tax=Corchorus olitorius TaxID=93759 RepID=A0A1R3JXF7_9ROSI|nr:Diacylglycerol acyltransferase [Corchorus olitorius]
MVAIGVSGYPAAVLSSFSQRRTTSYGGIQKCSRILAISTEKIESSVSTEQIKRARSFEDQNNGMFDKKKKKEETEEVKVKLNLYSNPDKIPDMEEGKKSLNDYLEECKEFIRSNQSGPPRWFSPLDCSVSSPESPLLLFLPGIDGTGLGLIRHYHNLAKMFNIWCLHIPVKDRTPFPELVKLVERTIRSENYRSPKRPIYLVGESLGACLALTVAARNPEIDLVLILYNPATSFSKSVLQPLIPMLEIMPDQFPLNLTHLLSLATGSLTQTIGELIPQDLVSISSYLPVLADMLPRETLLWKLGLLKSGSASANSCLHAVKAQMLLLFSGRDQLLPSQEESKRFRKALPDCEIRMFEENGHFLFLEDKVDLVTIIKGASFYRRGKHLNYVSDYIPPTPNEFKRIYESVKWIITATDPVMLSTMEDGKVVRGLAGIPSNGPVLFVGYHMLMGIETISLVTQLLIERNIVVRGLTHPSIFVRIKDRRPGDPEPSDFDLLRVMGAVPVSAGNFYKLMSSKSHVLLYPGGAREALHRKGEEYKLFWPEQSEFVRMAAKFGAKIVPFGVVGEDDIAEIIIDYNDQIKIPWLREEIERTTERISKPRSNASGEVANQPMHMPWMLPKFPGRFYYYFGKPIETQGMKVELEDRDKSHQLYLHVKSEVERCIAYLKQKREKDPFRNLLSRLLYQAIHGSISASQIPTFDLSD